jgi:hypothetical protein
MKVGEADEPDDPEFIEVEEVVEALLPVADEEPLLPQAPSAAPRSTTNNRRNDIFNEPYIESGQRLLPMDILWILSRTNIRQAYRDG